MMNQALGLTIPLSIPLALSIVFSRSEKAKFCSTTEKMYTD
jgi:hypothetical protein